MPPKKRNRREASKTAKSSKKSSRNEYGSSDEDEAPTLSRQAFFPRRRNEQYPQHLMVNLLQLDLDALHRYIEYYGIRVRPDASQAELATGVAQHFDSYLAVQNEDDTISAFVQAYKRAKLEKQGRLGGSSGQAGPTHALERGDQVAAKLNPDDPWILASIVKYMPQKDKYQVEDEDDDEDEGSSRRSSRRRHTVSSQYVVPLPKEHEAESFRAGDRVIAIYPNTTSFYSSTVVVAPRQSAARVTVKFDDDEDESGTIPEHRIARRYVLSMPSV